MSGSSDVLKLKKKVVSLVSNYSDEEITESENDEEESQEEVEDDESSRNVQDINVGDLKNVDEIEELKDLNGENSNNVKSPGSNQNDAMTNGVSEVKADDLVGETVESDQLTIENGFLPGCENIKLPPVPTTECSRQLQDKIIKVRDRMLRFNYNINEDIQSKKNFKNPSFYEKLIEHYDLDECGSNFSSHIEDLHGNGYLYYEELDVMQRNDWAKKEKEKKERVTK